MRPRTALLRGRGLNRWLLYPLVALAAAASASLAAEPEPARADTTYTVIQLSPDFSGGSINDKGQVAFTERVNGAYRAKFYDGKTVRDIGTLGGPTAIAAALNNSGQVTGTADVNADGSISHAYRWSQATGMLDLNNKRVGNSRGNDINNKGQVTGFDGFTGHAFFWSRHTGMLDIGALGPFSSSGSIINDSGTIAGDSEGPQGGPFSIMTFRWTMATGIQDIGTRPDEFTYTLDMNELGHIVGETPFPPGGQAHAFLWTQRGGLMDLGTGSQNRSTALAINDKDMVVGFTETRFTNPGFAFVWTRQTGLQELTEAGSGSAANDVNNRGQVVGGQGNSHAFLWTRAQGLVDLNTRIPGAPAGLTLIAATKISENGAILAEANTGLVLLVPHCACSGKPPAVGAIGVSGNAHPNMPLTFSAAFSDVDVRDTHKATWSWGDGNIEPGTVSEKNGAGSVSAQHTYRSPGIYTVTLTVTDSSGRSTTVQRKVVICGAGQHLSGTGSITSPLGASRLAPKQGGTASFAFLSGAQTSPSVQFSAPGISLTSGAVRLAAAPGGQMQYVGTGTVNGVAGYHFTLAVAPGGNGTDRVRVRIWHYGADGKTEIVDYDNLPRGAGPHEVGTPLVDGKISTGSD